MSKKVYQMIAPEGFTFYKILFDLSDSAQIECLKNDITYINPYESHHLIYVKVYDPTTMETISELRNYLEFNNLISIIKTYLSSKYFKKIFIGICDIDSYTVKFNITRHGKNEPTSFYYFVKEYLKNDTSMYTPAQLISKFNDLDKIQYEKAFDFKECEDKTNQWFGYEYCNKE